MSEHGTIEKPRTDAPAAEPAPAPAEEYVPVDDAIIGRAFRWSLVVIVIAAVAIGGLLLLRGGDEALPVVIDRDPVEAPERMVVDTRAPALPFTDVTSGAGVTFVHENGARGRKLLPETMGGGVAFFDYDGDDDADLLLVDSTTWDGADAGRTRLYRNDGLGTFTDVTDESGLGATMYGLGVAVADYDADGDRDVYLTALGANRLYRNDGGRFTDVTAPAGVAGGDADWSTSAGFFDADGDGDLDLFVCNYIEWSQEKDLELDFTLNGTDRAYGPPKLYRGAHCALYRNDGDGAFTDVSAASGIEVDNPATGGPMGKALAVTFADADGDGDMDVFVANDTVQNFVFQNAGDGTFEEIGALSGLAYDSMGQATGAMGMDAADYRNEGALALAIGNFANEATSFYVQQPNDRWSFADMSGSEGIGSPSRVRLSFGLFFFDADLDGRLDLLQANGHLEDEINQIQASQHYEQPAQLFWNAGADARANFTSVPDEQLGDFATPIVGRGAAYADIDGDGDLDVILTQAGRGPLLLRNDQALGHDWIRMRLVDRAPNVDAIGAWVEVTADGVTQRRQVMPTRSYLSQVELPVTFGLGSASIERVRVIWPDGTTQDVPTFERNALNVVERK